MSIVVRRAEVDDFRAITQIYNQPLAYSGTLQLPYTSEATWKARLENATDDMCNLVACVDGELVGSLVIFIVTQPLRRRHVGGIGMGVQDHWHGKGIGSKLLTEAIKLADDWYNLVRLELTVFVDNTAAVALYKKHGFRIEGTLEKYAYRAGDYADAYTMARIKVAQQRCKLT